MKVRINSSGASINSKKRTLTLFKAYKQYVVRFLCDLWNNRTSTGFKKTFTNRLSFYEYHILIYDVAHVG